MSCYRSVCNNSLNTEAPAVTDEGVVYDSGVCTNLETAASAGSLVSLTTGLLMSVFASVLARTLTGSQGKATLAMNGCPKMTFSLSASSAQRLLIGDEQTVHSSHSMLR